MASDRVTALRACTMPERAEAVEQLAGLLAAVQAELLDVVRAADLEEDWRVDGANDPVAWLMCLLRVSHRTAAEWVRVAAAFEHLPALREALADGRLCWDVVAPATVFATPDTDAELARRPPRPHRRHRGRPSPTSPSPQRRRRRPHPPEDVVPLAQGPRSRRLPLLGLPPGRARRPPQRDPRARGRSPRTRCRHRRLGAAPPPGRAGPRRPRRPDRGRRPRPPGCAGRRPRRRRAHRRSRPPATARSTTSPSGASRSCGCSATPTWSSRSTRPTGARSASGAPPRPCPAGCDAASPIATAAAASPAARDRSGTATTSGGGAEAVRPMPTTSSGCAGGITTASTRAAGRSRATPRPS